VAYGPFPLSTTLKGGRSIEEFLQAVINGVMLGGFYAAMMLGFSVIWGVMGVINLAHGEFVMVGAYITWLLSDGAGMDPFVAILLVFPIMFVVGYLLQRVLINRIVDRPHLVALLVTFGLSIIMANAVKLRYSATPRLTDTALEGVWHPFGSVTIPRTKTGILIVALLVMGLLWLFLNRTKLGKSIRAAAQNKQAARIVGIDVKKIYAITFGISIAITGVAGALISSTQAVFPFMGPPLTLRAFTITALAGLGNIPGALMGGITLGLVESFIGIYVEGIGTNLAIVASFALLWLILVTRPQGLFGGLRPAEEPQPL
jgi:branched-chain amino acid transport system permease protein